MKLPLLVLVGPTASGKSAVAVAAARRLGGEIISGDSMQVYRGLDIGTAKVTPAEMMGIPHHMIDIKDPDEEFSVAEFRSLVDRLVPEIINRGRLPMLVGGTGLYVRAVLQEYIFSEQDADTELRRRLAAEEEREGRGHLHRRLAAVDPAAATKLHPNDLRRIIRALEVYEVTGEPISATQVADQAERRYDDLFLGLTLDRERLYERIGRRVDQMIAQGLETEVLGLLRQYPPDLAPLQAIGYREMVQYARGLLTLAEATALIQRNTRRFAKRQFTWFRRESTLKWLDAGAPLDSVVEEIVNHVEGKCSTVVEARSLWSRVGKRKGGGQAGV